MTLTGAEFLADAQGKLLLRGKQLSDTDLKQICEGLPPELSEIDLSSNSIGDSGVELLVNALKDRKGIAINLSDNNVGDEGVQQLSKLILSGTIRALDLSMNEISAAGVANISFADSGLKALKLRGNEIGDEGAIHISKAMSALPHSLCQLDLGNNGIGADGASAVLEASALCGLQSLCLDDCTLPPSNFSDLIVSLSKAGSSHLSLRCVGLTSAGASALATAFALNPPATSLVVDLRDNSSCGDKGLTALSGLTRMKSQLQLRL